MTSILVFGPTVIIYVRCTRYGTAISATCQRNGDLNDLRHDGQETELYEETPDAPLLSYRRFQGK